MARKQVLQRLPFPLLGLNETASYEDQQTGSTADCLNVRAFDPTTGRARGGQRGGLTEVVASLGPGPIQELYHIVYAIGATPALFSAVGYLIAGTTGGTAYLADTDQYDSGGDAWANKTDMPAPDRTRPGAFTIGNAGYALGGQGPDGTTTHLRDTDQYIPDVWTAKTDMPTPARLDGVGFTIDSAGYVATGSNDVGSFTSLLDCDEYVPDTWASKTNAPSPSRREAAGATLGSAGYVIGGVNGVSTGLQDCDQYVVDTWTSKTDMPAPVRRAPAVATVSAALYSFNGFSSAHLRDTDQYVVDTWTSKTDTPTPARWKSTAQALGGGAAYIWAGVDSGGSLQDNDEYVPDVWTSKTNTPTPARSSCGGVSPL